MADHVRKQVRAALKTRVTGLTTTGTRVHGRRAHPLDANTKLPALCVYTEGDGAEAATIHGPALVEREVEFHVQGIAAAVDDSIEDTLDTIAKEVETALATALVVGSKSVLLVYQRSTIDFEDGEKRAGVVDMVFRARIYNQANTPDVLS
jgi:hypothetical protein